MAKVEAESGGKRIQISQLPIYSASGLGNYEEVDDAGVVTTTLRGYVSPLTRALLPALVYVKGGGERVKEIGQTGYAHTMTSVQMIQDDPYGPASIAGGAAGGLLVGIRGGKVMKAVLAVSGAALGGYIYYWQPLDQATKVFDNIKNSVEDYLYPSEKKTSPITQAPKETKTDS